MNKLLKRNFSSSSISIALVGYPNVGKSTYFNALMRKQLAEARNMPYCTINPNIASIEVEDDNITKLQKITNINNIKPFSIEIKDVAGLIKGSSEGKGVGNLFLSTLRSCDAIIQILRCFKNENIDYIDKIIDPVNEMSVVHTELILSDLEMVKKKLANFNPRRSPKEEKLLLEYLDVELNKGKLAKDIFHPSKQESNMTICPPPAGLNLSDHTTKNFIKSLHLITAKPIFYIFNVEPPEIKNEYITNLSKIIDNDDYIISSVLLENEATMFAEDKEKYSEAKPIIDEYMSEYEGLEYNSLNIFSKIIKKLDYNVFYTLYGGNILSSFLIKNGENVVQAASKVHSDFAKNFICAEVTRLEDWVKYENLENLKKNNKIVKVNRDYEVKNDDIITLKSN